MTGSLSCVTVVHPDCIQADALATALTAMGAEDGFAFAVRRGSAAMFTMRGPDGWTETTTPAMDAMLAD